MPIFEYVCRDCHRPFEALVTADRRPVCPSCKSESLDKQLSVFAVSTRSTTTSSAVAPCGTCGDVRGPGACSMN
jgi:putative FmdB family regulatory protein